MNAIETSACNITFTLAGCDDLPARRDIEDGCPVVSTYCAPSDEERALLAAGFPVKLTVQGSNPQPVRMEVDTL